MRAANQKRFQDVTTKPTTDKQTNNWPTILSETQYFPFEKKTNRSWSESPHWRPRQIRSLQAKLAGNAKKF